MSMQAPPPNGKKQRGRPAKYRNADERQRARREQVRQATRTWRENQHAADKVTHSALRDAGAMIERVLNNMLQLAARVNQQPERYPAGFDDLLQLYASEARSAVSHLSYVLQRQEKSPNTD